LSLHVRHEALCENSILSLFIHTGERRSSSPIHVCVDDFVVSMLTVISVVNLCITLEPTEYLFTCICL